MYYEILSYLKYVAIPLLISQHYNFLKIYLFERERAYTGRPDGEEGAEK